MWKLPAQLYLLCIFIIIGFIKYVLVLHTFAYYKIKSLGYKYTPAGHCFSTNPKLCSNYWLLMQWIIQRRIVLHTSSEMLILKLLIDSSSLRGSPAPHHVFPSSGSGGTSFKVKNKNPIPTAATVTVTTTNWPRNPILLMSHWANRAR